MRTHRRRWRLTQNELAHLLGAKCRTQLSRYERGFMKPKLCVVLAYQVVFGELPHNMFPKFFSQVEKGVMRRAYQLYQKLEPGTTEAEKRKLELLRDIFRRGTIKPSDDDA